MRRLYVVTRALHLYVGLFLSPFVLVFAVSVSFLVPGLVLRPSPGPSNPSRTVAGIQVTPGIARLQGRAPRRRASTYARGNSTSKVRLISFGTCLANAA